MARKNSNPPPPELDETPKKASRRPTKPKTEPTAEPEAKPKAVRRAKTAPAVEPEPVADVKAQKPRRGKKADPAPEPEAVPAPEPKKPARARRSKTTGTEAHADPTPEPVVEKAKPAARKPRGRAQVEPTAEPDMELEAVFRPAKRGRKAEPKTPVVDEIDYSQFGDDIPIPTWRARAGSAGSSEDEGGNGGKVAARRSRRRRRKDLVDVDITAAAALEPAEPKAVEERPRRGRRGPAAKTEPVEEAPAPLPTPPPKPLIPTPPDAPQVVLRNGVPIFVRDGRIYPPIGFFGSSTDERRSRTVMDEIRLAAENGIHLHSHLIELEVDANSVATSVSLAGYLLRQTLTVDPEAQVLFRVVFVAPNGWPNRFPNAAFSEQSGRLAEPSLCDDEFWGEARSCLKSFVQSIRTLDEKAHIFGLHLERGEWFFADGVGYDTSKAAVEKFRDWARTRYLNDIVSLRAAWFDGGADFETLTVPAYRHPSDEGEKFVRSSRRERRWVDYHLFLSDSTIGRIGDLAYAAKEASEGNFVIGVSYGYTFEWSHPSSGHLSLGKLLRTHEVDFIAGPPSYRNREAGGTAAFPGPLDSFALNGKIYISEEDFKTSIGEWKEPDDFNPVIRTPQALESVHWRGIGSALAHASGVTWMDLWGNGWLKTATIWKRGAQAKECLMMRIDTPQSPPDIAVFIDERALAYLVDQTSFALLVQNVRESVLRSGVSAGFYLLSDLTHRENFPESRLYIFLNAWDIRSDLRAAIKSRLQRDGKVLFWLYGAGMFDSGRESLERAREVTGVALKPQPFHSRAGSTILNRKHPLSDAFPEKGQIGGGALDPTYFAIPEESLVLGEYTQTGLPSFVVKEFNTGDPSTHWKSVFMGEPVVTPALVRALSLLAGAHVWNYQDDVVHVRRPFLTVHCSGSGPRAITLPEKWAAYNVTTQEWTESESTSLRFNALDGSTHVFLVGRQSEIESMLALDPDEVLKLAELPAQTEDTVRFDAISFDVPIMKLGEWMEGGTLDDVSEDWLLHPKVSDLDSEDDGPPEDTDRPGRRSRRRRRSGNGEREGGGRRRGGAVETVEAPGEDMSLSVVFRKRE